MWSVSVEEQQSTSPAATILPEVARPRDIASAGTSIDYCSERPSQQSQGRRRRSLPSPSSDPQSVIPLQCEATCKTLSPGVRPYKKDY